MVIDEESKKDIYVRIKALARLDGATILQVDATVIIGVLFFLTLSSFLGFSTEEQGKAIVAQATYLVIFPFSMSAILVLYSNDDLQSEFRKFFKHFGPLNERDYRRMASLNKYAGIATMLGFIYLLGAILYILYNTDVALSEPSKVEECGENPRQFGVNQTALWQCSMFTAGSLAEQCANDASRFHMNSTSQCSEFIPPPTESGG